MLMEFKVKNFKNFKKELHLNLGKTSDYDFNESAVANGIVKTALIYGENGSGKTNLGYAIFDIILHLVDKEKELDAYNLYANLESDELPKFYYKFKFGEDIVEYCYKKAGPQELLKEVLYINGKKVIFYDFESNESAVLLKGAENLNTNLKEKKISFVKYIYNNTVLAQNRVNELFNLFIDFVDRMLFFSSLERNHYQGFRNGHGKVAEEILKLGKLKDFELFLRKVGINYELVEREVDGQKKIYCKYGKKEANFYSIASRGTCSLSLFYYWSLHLEKVSMVFIDEFDAFYHNNLARKVIQEVLQLKNTQAIFTTHNTDIMTNELLRPDCYMQIIDGNIRSFADSTDKELRKAHNLQKMYKAGVFDYNPIFDSWKVKKWLQPQ